MNRQSLKILISALASMSFAMTAQAGHGVGNGGDYIRASFMTMGWATVQYLNESDEGMRLRDANHLDTNALLATLDINVIEVQDGLLIDNGGSVVDAIGSKDKIILSRDHWAEHLSKDRDIYFLVFHEMLRATGVDDDNYLISKAIAPFPASRRIMTRVASLYPIVGQTPLDEILSLSRIQIDGSGCSSAIDGTMADIDLERNILSLSLRRFDIQLRQALSDQKSCTIVVPYKIPSGKRLIVSQLDLSAKVILSDKTKAAIASDAVFGGTSIGAKSKSITSVGETQGRLFLRNISGASSGCNGSTGLLKIRASGSAQKLESTSEPNYLLGDHVAVSFAIEDCATGLR